MNSDKKQNGHSAVLKNIVGLMGILMVMPLTACSNEPEVSEDVAQNLQMEPEVLEGTAQNVQTEQETTESQSIPDEVFDTKEPLDSQNEENSDGQIKKDNELESLAGEYEYRSDYGTGNLIIKKTAYGYDISDYESESSYRFLADSSNIDVIKNNRIYIKYPEQAFSDGIVIWSYYILEYSTDGINVYYAKSADEEGQFLYHATRK